MVDQKQKYYVWSGTYIVYPQLLFHDHACRTNLIDIMLSYMTAINVQYYFCCAGESLSAGNIVFITVGTIMGIIALIFVIIVIFFMCSKTEDTGSSASEVLQE